jgi:hypothetical protein
MLVGSGWERDADSGRKLMQVPDGNGCRFQHRKHQRVPVFSATVKDQGISLLVYSTQKVVECCTNVPFFGGKNLQKKRDPTTFHLPPCPTKAYLSYLPVGPCAVGPRM